MVSNRGPVSFSHGPGGELVPRRGAGGLVSSIGPLLRGTGATWMAAAMTDADREAAGAGVVEAEGFRFRSLDLDPVSFAQYYDVVANATLWFLYHGLADAARRPRYDHRWHEAWDGYRRVNEAFARAVVEEAPDGAVVLVQDYHLVLVGRWLAAERPDLRAVHFHHTPFCDPVALRALPDAVADELLAAASAYTACGFHARRWADRFAACAEARLGGAPPTFVAPIAPDPDDLAEVAASGACAEALARLERSLDGRRLILRVDRLELSKNLLRGFWAFDELLEHHPDLRGEVTFVALCYPSRESLAEYQAYRLEVEAVADLVNRRWARPGWTPLVLDTADDFASSVAALRRYDVLLVNPVRDGLNLVAKEGAMLNERHGAVVLSTEAGVFDELGGAALAVNPYDVSATAEALADALALGPAERARRAEALRAAAGARTPRDWLEDQLRAAGLSTSAVT